MNCKENESMIYVWNELTENERALLLNHIAKCAACARLYEETGKLQLTIERLAAERMPEENAARVTSRVMSAVHQEQPAEVRTAWSRLFSVRQARYVFAFLSLLLLATFGIEFLQGAHERPRNDSVKTDEMVILSSSIIHATREERKKQKSISATCRSPFIDQLTYLQCVKDQIR